MKGIEILKIKGRNAVLALRKDKLSNGHSFMINSENLPQLHCYLENPDGSVHLVSLSKTKMDFELVKILSDEESSSLRNELGLE